MRKFIYLTLASLSALVPCQNVKMEWVKEESYGKFTLPQYATSLDDASFAVLSEVTRFGRTDGILCNYGMDGTTNWVKTLWNTNQFKAVALLKGDNGDVYVVGSVGATGSEDTYVARVAASGATIWAKRWNQSVENRSDYPMGASLDAMGNVYVTGSVHQQSSKVSDLKTAFISKISMDGGLAYTKTYSGGDANYEGSEVSVNAAGHVAVCVQNTHDLVWKLNTQGGTVWIKTPIIISDCQAILMDNSGNIFLGGTRLNSATDGAPAVQKLDTNGNLLWTRWTNFGSDVDAIDHVNSLHLDAFSNLYATGTATSLKGTDSMLLKYAQNGETLGTRLNNSQGSNNDTSTCVTIGLNNEMYLTGAVSNAKSSGFFASRLDSDSYFNWNRNSLLIPGVYNDYKGSAFSPQSGQLMIMMYNADSGNTLLQVMSQTAIAKADAYKMLLTSGSMHGSSVLNNDVYAADGSALLVSTTTRGTLTLDADGTFDYMPDTKFTGTDTFTYRITKPGLDSSFLATVTINVQ